MKEKDEDLYLRCYMDKEIEALEILIDRYRESLTMFLYGIIGNMEDAEELAIDTFALLIYGKARYKVQKGCSFKTWLYSVGRKQALLRLRKRKFFSVPLTNQTDLSQSSPEDIVFKEDRDRELHRALSQLKDEYRQVLYLLYFEGMSHKEIAGVMKKSIKQVYNLASRGRRSLEEILRGKGFS